jgi:hypothetical protein
MKTPNNVVYEERFYKGDAVFGGKNYFELLGEMNRPPNSKMPNMTEFGKMLFSGRTKIIRKTNVGKIETREIVYPGIYADDLFGKTRKRRFARIVCIRKDRLEFIFIVNAIFANHFPVPIQNNLTNNNIYAI